MTQTNIPYSKPNPQIRTTQKPCQKSCGLSSRLHSLTVFSWLMLLREVFSKCSLNLFCILLIWVGNKGQYLRLKGILWLVISRGRGLVCRLDLLSLAPLGLRSFCNVCRLKLWLIVSIIGGWAELIEYRDYIYYEYFLSD